MVILVNLFQPVWLGLRAVDPHISVIFITHAARYGILFIMVFYVVKGRKTLRPGDIVL